jgi:hypothetical protein
MASETLTVPQVVRGKVSPRETQALVGPLRDIGNVVGKCFVAICNAELIANHAAAYRQAV